MIEIEKNLKKHFKEADNFTRNELYQFYLFKEPQLNKNTFSWRIYNLKRKGVIREVGRGLYSFFDKNNYSRQLSKHSEKIGQNISKSFTEINFCVSDSTWINEFTSHQYSNNYIIIEIEKDFLESVFFSLTETFKNIFLKPNDTELDRYISDLDSAIILIPLLTRAPIQTSENQKQNVPRLEKLLVDIFSKTTPYLFLTNSEIKTIFSNAFRKCNINQTTLLAYAKRRGKNDEIKNYLIENKLFKVVND